MSLFNRFLYLLPLLLFVLICIKSSLSYNYQAFIVQNFTSLIQGEEQIPKTKICDLDLEASRNQCSIAAKTCDCSDYGCKILFGRPGDPWTYEFEYVNPRDGKLSEKLWAVRCPSRPVIFITAGDTDEHWGVLILKQDANSEIAIPTYVWNEAIRRPPDG